MHSESGHRARARIEFCLRPYDLMEGHPHLTTPTLRLLCLKCANGLLPGRFTHHLMRGELTVVECEGRVARKPPPALRWGVLKRHTRGHRQSNPKPKRWTHSSASSPNSRPRLLENLLQNVLRGLLSVRDASNSGRRRTKVIKYLPDCFEGACQ